MEALLSQFTFLSDQSLLDKTFDPSTIEDLMKLFEIESYKAWAAAELEQETELEETEHAMQEAEEHLDSVMESAMDEFRRFEEEMERISRDEVESLVQTAEKARKMGNLMEKSAAIASKKYMEAALNSATSSMKSAWKGISSGKDSYSVWCSVKVNIHCINTNKFIASPRRLPLLLDAKFSGLMQDSPCRSAGLLCC
ncbi:hypothetical protein KIW84_015825 [Lathyrus oleraceus]|uniref:Uncharacterized protein n=1 Tax=Pisum sativum TaxID=3888 RepID=A0A9D5BRB2_PEA|nr:hypothetical protein KIW84_015825 [Pisum sativum]